jgi:hypothetical protein
MTSIRSLVTPTALAVTLVAVFASPATASHVRGAHLSWTRVDPTRTEVVFHSVQEFRADDVEPLPVNPGDGDVAIIGPVSTIFSGVDGAGEFYRIIQYDVPHTYPTPNPNATQNPNPTPTPPYTAFLGLEADPTNCCRLLSLVNASNSNYRFETVVDLGSNNGGSPAGTIPPFASSPMILQMPAGTMNASVSFSIADPDYPDTFDCSMASTLQSGIPMVATAASVLAVEVTPTGTGCVLSWNTMGTIVNQKYAVQVELTEHHLGNADAHTALDFILEIVAPTCGDNARNGMEECDGTDDDMCTGACRPPGPNGCTCPRCGDEIIDVTEQCDGNAGGIFGPCPGECIATGMNACRCAVCGDNETSTVVGEECDGADATACPGACLGTCQCPHCGNNVVEGTEQCDGNAGVCPSGACLPSCVCAVCGDNAVNAPGEQCDGTADGTCPGHCLPNCKCTVCGDGVAQGTEQCDGADAGACPGPCTATCVCAVCGDNAVNAPGEQCDGTADGACPGRCLANCRCAVCGDNVAQGPEQCDGSDASACPGACLPNCVCQICGDNVIEGSEQCDGASAAACPGLCRPPNDQNECKCPVCGDNDVNQGSEQCDGTDDGACVGKCTATCTCAVCGDNLAQAPAETCDGTDDAACPGQCALPGAQNECRCPVCGDDDINVAGEECDGTDDLACPAACAGPAAPNACRCPHCGDGIVNQPSEECDGDATGQCANGVCQPDCTFATCGNCMLDAGEQCDPPNREICNNLIDDDGDGKLNCDDTDCTPGRTCKHADAAVNALVSGLACASSTDCNGLCSHDLTTSCTSDAQCGALATGSFCVTGAKCTCPDTAPGGFETCGAACTPVFGCRCIHNDPARITFAKTPGGLDLYKVHGRFLFDDAMDPPADGFTILLTNAAGIIYQGTLRPGDLVGRPGSFTFTDRGAKTGTGLRDGLYKVSVRLKTVKGAVNYVFKAQAYGDLSSASAFMTTQVIAGNNTASLSAEWTRTAKGWTLISFE